MTDLRNFDAERRRILRRLSMLTWGLWATVAILAALGGLIMAWLFQGLLGLSFPVLWLLGAVVLVAVPAAAQAIIARRGPRGDGSKDGP